jgi:hypothetical protein
MLDLEAKEIPYLLKNIQPVSKSHRDVLRTDNDLRNALDVPFNAHMNDDTTVCIPSSLPFILPSMTLILFRLLAVAYT